MYHSISIKQAEYIAWKAKVRDKYNKRCKPDWAYLLFIDLTKLQATEVLGYYLGKGVEVLPDYLQDILDNWNSKTNYEKIEYIVNTEDQEEAEDILVERDARIADETKWANLKIKNQSDRTTHTYLLKHPLTVKEKEDNKLARLKLREDNKIAKEVAAQKKLNMLASKEQLDFIDKLLLQKNIIRDFSLVDITMIFANEIIDYIMGLKKCVKPVIARLINKDNN